MKKIGREVFFIGADENHPRNGEGSFLRLKNGSIMYAYTEFVGESRDDGSAARISAWFSKDEGESWEGKRVLIEKPEYALNVMCATLLRLGNGDIGLFYGVKTQRDRRLFMDVEMRRSSDEGLTWGNPVSCIGRYKGYYVYENDRVIRLRSGRLLLTANLTEFTDFRTDGSGKPVSYGNCIGKSAYFYSDDDGYTWLDTGNAVEIPFSGSTTGLQESGTFERDDGVLWSYSRTAFGSQYESFSSDGGISWSVPRPNEILTSAISPMTAGRFGRLVAAVMNPVPSVPGLDPCPGTWGRTPLALRVSRDGGKTFRGGDFYLIEDDPKNGYCYPNLFDGGEYMLVAYYHSGGDEECCLTCAKIVRIEKAELGICL